MNQLQEQRRKVEAEAKKLEVMGGSVRGRLEKVRDSSFKRFPIIFILLSSFGLVATFYGFEKVIDGVPFFNENPMMILVTGIATLIITGSLYKKLG